MSQTPQLMDAIEQTVFATARKLEEGAYEELAPLMTEFETFTTQIGAMGYAESKQFEARIAKLYERLEQLLLYMETHREHLRDELDTLRQTATATKAYAKSEYIAPKPKLQ